MRCVGLNGKVCIGNVELVTQLKLDTLILHVAHVTDRLGFTYVAWDRHGHQHTIGLLDIVVNSKCKLVVPQAQVDTQVGLLTLLPLQVLVSQAVGFRTVVHHGLTTEIVVAGAASGGEYGITEIVHILVTVLTPTCTEFQVRQPVACVLHEFFVHDVPSNRE